MTTVLVLILASALILYTAHRVALRVAYAASGVHQMINPRRQPNSQPKETTCE